MVLEVPEVFLCDCSRYLISGSEPESFSMNIVMKRYKFKVGERHYRFCNYLHLLTMQIITHDNKLKFHELS